MGSLGYDFHAARERRNELVLFYRRLKRMGLLTEELELILLVEIGVIDEEIQAAHRSTKAKMTTVGSSGHSVIQYQNIYTPIIPQWGSGDKEEVHA